jgi:hypothetical protein
MLFPMLLSGFTVVALTTAFRGSSHVRPRTVIACSRGARSGACGEAIGVRRA